MLVVWKLDREREDGRRTGERWGEARGLGLRDVSPLHVAAYIRTRRGREGPEARRHQGGRGAGDAAAGAVALDAYVEAGVLDDPKVVLFQDRRPAGRR